MATVSEWIEKDKVPASQIAIFAPQMKTYWPVLSMYLEQEGIPFHRNDTLALSAPQGALSPLICWMARLRLYAGLHDRKGQDVEYLHYLHYTGSSHPQGSYKNFILDRSLWLSGLKEPSFAKLKEEWVLDPATPLSRDAFVDWAIRQWDPQGPVEELKRVLSLLCQESFPHKVFTLETWMTYLQGLLLKPAPSPLDLSQEEGIHCMDISFSTSCLEVTHRLFLGLTDSAFGDSHSSLLLEKDILHFMEVLGGLDFPLMEEKYLEFEFHWIREMPAKKSFYFFSESDFLGRLQVPFRFWLLEAGKARIPSKPSSPHSRSRWDRLQRNLTPSNLKLMRGTDEAYGSQLLKHLAYEMGQKPFEPFGQNPEHAPSLSASRWINYVECPFIFAAGKLFRPGGGVGLGHDVGSSDFGEFISYFF